MRWLYPVWLLAGCTAANPKYHGAVADAAAPRDLSSPPLPDAAVGDAAVGDAGLRDAAAPHDLTVAPDLASFGPCVAGERQCGAGGNVSLACEAGMLVIDRHCPGQSRCAGGVCGAPPSGSGSLGQSCDQSSGPRENDCQPQVASDPTCAPFLDGTNVVWFCAEPIGAGGPGTACTSGRVCRSGFCGSNGTCFRACQQDSDCPPAANGTPGHCAAVTIVVEGRTVDAASCVSTP